ncbi:MAG: rhomboid family intramembrane serine protease [Spirochaetota bacterium]|nr:rhomboid family intramembrane serine protease [Spirochaetota bacterium]
MLRRTTGFRIGGPLTPIVKKLIVINAGVFIFQQFIGLFLPGEIENIFGLHHLGIFYDFRIWQIFTYMFLHGGWMHIIFNLIALWMFAGELEARWGQRLFLQYYIYSGVGAGIFIAVMNALVYSSYNVSPITIGASGAIYGILLAYGLTWPNREILLYFIFPVKIKYLLIAFGIIEFFGTIANARGTGGNISHIGHLGGLICGFIYYKYKIQISITAKKHRNNDGLISQYLKKKRLEKKQKEIDNRIKAKKIIDSLLEKIARDGMSSLTSQEKSQLDWARKNYYPENHETLH